MKAFRFGASVIAVGIALLQTAPVMAQATTGQAEGAGPASADEIVVTALRRNDSLSKAPVAISAVSGAQLTSQGVTQAKDLTNVLPNVENSVAGFAIRGVSSADFLPKGDPATAFNVNGVYIARPAEQQLAMFDVDRVEVLRGPQGTLYGRNATAGVVNVISVQPTDRFEGNFSAEYGNWNTVRLNGAINAPLSENVALRLAGTFNRHDGYTKTRDGTRALDDQNNFGLRGSLKFNLGASTDFVLTADYAKQDEAGPAFIAASRAVAQNDDHSLRYALPGIDNHYFLEAGGISGELNSDLGFAKLTYVGSYRKSKLDVLNTKNDATLTSQSDRAYSLHRHDQTTQEVRLSSNAGGPFQWVAGAYYFHEYETYQDYLNLCCFFNALFAYDQYVRATTYAGFGNATYSLTNNLRLTGGLRWTHDTKERIGKAPAFFYGAPQLPLNQLPATNNTSLFVGQPINSIAYYPGGGAPASKLTWKAQIEGDLSRDVIAYAKVETGYKAGGFNDGVATAANPIVYQPELITDYEAGVKGTVLDGRLYFSLNLFHYDYKNHQVSAVSPFGGATTFNAPAKVTGAELEGWIKPARNTRISYSVAVLDTKYGHFFPGALTGNTTTDFVDQPLDVSPKFSARVALNQDIPLASGARISGNVAVKYSSSYKVTDYIPSGGAIVRYNQKEYTRTEVSLGYFAPGDAYYIQAFGRNLENKRRLGVVELGGFTLSEPSQYGVRAGVKF
ncbi:TonB-dependent receptor [Novosphingobium flavum]|uniref:TonB-dependent receptor n=1 Tax=Novosphingobium flavum TaxID=1778672 RepID=A0A7X1FTJ2_9SPHN|nr:TonB-dependent receptor [Novosphingobium flavum]MBC2666693.1 TonB-dependent receptor [Novosphingobium flavum]